VKDCTKAEALALLHDTLSEINKGTYVKPSAQTFAQYLDEWYALRCEPRLAPATKSAYNRVVNNYLVPALGSTMLSNLQPLAFDQALLAWRVNGAGERTLFQIYHVAHTALAQAVKWRKLSVNPLDAVDAPRVEHKEVTALSPEEAMRLEEIAKQYAVYPFVFLALHTGMRRGELLALRWRNVDLGAGAIHVEESRQFIDGQTYTGPPKSAKGDRRIPLDEDSVSLLHELRRKNTQGSEFVLCKDDGTPYSPSYVSRRFHQIAARAGFAMRLHEARHTYVTTGLLAGVPMRVMQELAGHATFAMTSDLYSHVLQKLKTDAAKAIGKAYETGKRQESGKTATGDARNESESDR
jgi:integrase